MATATICGRRETGLTKFDRTPGGGRPAAIVLKSIGGVLFAMMEKAMVIEWSD